MTYKQKLAETFTTLSQDTKLVVLGYNIAYGSQALGTFKGVPKAQLIETPLAENLMMGMAIGMSLAGYKPIVYFERMDFILNAMDAIVSQLDKLNEISDGQFSPSVILRCVVGNKEKPIYTGNTHTADYSEALKNMVKIPVLNLDMNEIRTADLSYRYFLMKGESAIIVEYKDLYDNEI
jgi:pyruvate/2-oxoglutarate/acetoin dehydrogenase E1 component